MCCKCGSGKIHGGKADAVAAGLRALERSDNGQPLSNEELLAELKRRLS